MSAQQTKLLLGSSDSVRSSLVKVSQVAGYLRIRSLLTSRRRFVEAVSKSVTLGLSAPPHVRVIKLTLGLARPPHVWVVELSLGLSGPPHVGIIELALLLVAPPHVGVTELSFDKFKSTSKCALGCC